MAFTEKDFTEQQQAVADLEEEFSRLNAQFEAMLKEGGLSSDDLKKALAEKLSPEVQSAINAAKKEASRAGSARAAQGGGSFKTASTAGRGRPGVIRL